MNKNADSSVIPFSNYYSQNIQYYQFSMFLSSHLHSHKHKIHIFLISKYNSQCLSTMSYGIGFGPSCGARAANTKLYTFIKLSFFWEKTIIKHLNFIVFYIILTA